MSIRKYCFILPLLFVRISTTNCTTPSNPPPIAHTTSFLNMGGFVWGIQKVAIIGFVAFSTLCNNSMADSSSFVKTLRNSYNDEAVSIIKTDDNMLFFRKILKIVTEIMTYL